MRFTIGALHEIFQRKKYAARVAFLPSASVERLPHADRGSSSPGDAHERSEGKAASNKQEHGRMEGNSAPQGPATQILDGLGDLSRLDLFNANALPQVCLLLLAVCLLYTSLISPPYNGIFAGPRQAIPPYFQHADYLQGNVRVCARATGEDEAWIMPMGS